MHHNMVMIGVIIPPDEFPRIKLLILLLQQLLNLLNGGFLPMISYTFDTPLPIPQAHCNNNNKQNWIKE